MKSSSTIYDEQWRSSVDELVCIVTEEKSLYTTLPEKNRGILYGRVVDLYLRYVNVSRILNECNESLVHVQKREMVKKLLTTILGRIIELKNEMILLEFSETPYIGEAMERQHLAFDQVFPAVPSRERTDPNFVKTRRLVSDAVSYLLLKKVKQQDSSDIALTWDEAIVMIQIHERARQGKLRFQLMRQIRSQQILRITKSGAPRRKVAMNLHTAAIKIQSCWRRYHAKKIVEKMRLEEMEFLGMIPVSRGLSEAALEAQKLSQTRKNLQTVYREVYETDFKKTMSHIRSTEGEPMKRAYLEKLRGWYLEQKMSNGKFPEIPSEDDGGSRGLFPKELVAEEEIPQPAETKKVTESKAPEAAPKSFKAKKEEENRFKGFEIGSSRWLADIERQIDIYEDLWRLKSEVGSLGTVYDQVLLKEKATKQIEEEMRIAADAAARQEIEILKAAADRDKGKKTRKGRKLQRRGAKKAKRGRKDKDLTPDRTLESLVEELVACGVIRKPPEVSLDDFLGLPSIVNPLQRKHKRDSFGLLGDVKASLIENCLLPLYLLELRDKIPLTRSILLAGAHGAGKTHLVHALCHTMGAVLFDLSNASLMGKYPGKAGISMLIHLVNKVSKLVAPSVIVIEDADRIFMKKAPRTERWDIRRLRKEIPKLLRPITPENPVILLATCTTPWECDQKGLAQCFQRMIVVPTPDYGTRMLLWTELIRRSVGEPQRQLDFSCLARISESYATGAIARCVNEVLTERRKQLLARQPLNTEEFITALSRCEPFYKEEEDSLRSWYSKTPLRRRRNRAQNSGDDQDAAAGPEGHGKKKKKKKGKKKSKAKGKVTAKKKGIKRR